MQKSVPVYVQCRNTILSSWKPEEMSWHYETGLLLQSLLEADAVSRSTEGLRFVKQVMDNLIDKEGNIKGYVTEEYNCDQTNPGKVLFDLYLRTHDIRYRKAIEILRRQYDTHPRTKSGGFWHKKIYPHQIWLDGLYMRGPFLVRYGKEFSEPSLFDLVTHEVMLIEEKCRDNRTGLLYHGWDESKTQLWSNPKTGCSPHFWGRAMGWYVMALVDVLELLPPHYKQREPIQTILQRTMKALMLFQERKSGLWYQILDQQGRDGNYRESSASAMFVYSMAKGVRLKLLPHSYREAAEKGFHGLLKEKVTIEGDGKVLIRDICKVAGLGGNPYRDGSFAYYVGEPRVVNDPKGIGSFLLAAIEIEGRK